MSRWMWCGRIASIDLPKAAIMGNHDAWYTASEWGRKRCPYDRKKEDRVQQQLDLLGEAHVGYGKLDFPDLNLSVVGSRPYSWGGEVWKNKEFYRKRYGVTSFEESIERIVAAVKSAAYETIIFMGHNGPVGLGDRPEDPCGKDWQPLGGDYGDPDFAEAIAQTQALGKKIPLVTFGHMHHTLRHTKEKLRTPISTSPEGTVYLNSASVPRIIQTETTDSVIFPWFPCKQVSFPKSPWFGWAKTTRWRLSKFFTRRPEPAVVQPVYSSRHKRTRIDNIDRPGEVAEWSIASDLKSDEPKGSGSSNLPLSV
jgi:uncharacterized protein (TIGR04168 family)